MKIEKLEIDKFEFILDEILPLIVVMIFILPMIRTLKVMISEQ
jgi:hypothetical protein